MSLLPKTLAELVDKPVPWKTPDEERAARIHIKELQIKELPQAFKPGGVDREDAPKLRRLWEEAYRRIIDYYRQGGELPAPDKGVYTFTGANEVWRGHKSEMFKRGEEIGGHPIFDRVAVSAGRTRGSSNSKQSDESANDAGEINSGEGFAVHMAATSGRFADGPRRGMFHPIGAQFRARISPDAGGPDKEIRYEIDLHDDSGCDVQNITSEMWARINEDAKVELEATTIDLADGTNDAKFCGILEMRLMNKPAQFRDDWQPLTDWYEEHFIIQDGTALRLTGSNMREKLYFATCPWSLDLFVAKSKNALFRILPTGPEPAGIVGA